MLNQASHIILERGFYHSLKSLSPLELKTFLALALRMDSKTKTVTIAIKDLVQDIGISPHEADMAVKKLHELGLIHSPPVKDASLDIVCEIREFVWGLSTGKSPDSDKNIAEKGIVPQSGQNDIFSPESNKNSKNSRKSLNVNNDVNNNIYNYVNGREEGEEPNIPISENFKDFSPRTKLDLLAIDIAESLQDKDNLGLYLNYCKKYPLEAILRAWREVSVTPKERIRRSKGAYFTFLVQIYAKKY